MMLRILIIFLFLLRRWGGRAPCVHLAHFEDLLHCLLLALSLPSFCHRGSFRIWLRVMMRRWQAALLLLLEYLGLAAPSFPCVRRCLLLLLLFVFLHSSSLLFSDKLGRLHQQLTHGCRHLSPLRLTTSIITSILLVLLRTFWRGNHA